MQSPYGSRQGPWEIFVSLLLPISSIGLYLKPKSKKFESAQQQQQPQQQQSETKDHEHSSRSKKDLQKMMDI